jgi:glycerol kinase
VAWKLDGETTYCLDGQVYTAASAVTWLEKLGLIGGAADLDATARGSDRGAMFVPALAGLAAPFWAPEARAGWVGLSLATDRDDLVRAVAWGIAAQVASLASAIGEDLGRPLERLRVDGGLSRSSMLMQAQADLLQAPVERYASPNATALGAGALARLGIGASQTPSDAVGPWVPAATFEPTMGADEARVRLEGWERAASMLADLSRQEP